MNSFSNIESSIERKSPNIMSVGVDQLPCKGSSEEAVVEFTHQSEKLSYLPPDSPDNHKGVAVESIFVTPQDPVVVTSDGNRLPAVPATEAYKLNVLKEEAERQDGVRIHVREASRPRDTVKESEDSEGDRVLSFPREEDEKKRNTSDSTDGNLKRSVPPSHTHPLFPPLPLYGPSSRWRDIHCLLFRFTSFFLSLAFLGVIVLGSLFTSIKPAFQWIMKKLDNQDPDADRPFYEEEKRRQQLREQQVRQWKRRKSISHLDHEDSQDKDESDSDIKPVAPDPIVCDIGFYARRVGLDVETHLVETEDGFIIELWHVYDPEEYDPLPEEERRHRGPELFTGETRRATGETKNGKRPKFPVLLMHGLLQSSGAYCVNDEDSLAFFLCKSGYDVWLGNNRCGFKPRHVLLEYSDPRMWCWNIRQMGVFDLPALTSRVLYETGFEKVGLIAHSQGTTQTFVALAKEQRPDLGEKLTVFCALAPAAYAGPLIGKMYFKFMRVITPAMFRLLFGIHAFIPFMMTMHSILDGRVYGWLGYKVFSFLFNWTDRRWDRGLKNRMFQFAPVYVSAESMRWWLGRECFAKHKCILATKEEWRQEEKEDRELDKLDKEHEERNCNEKKADKILKAAERDMESNKESKKSEVRARKMRPKGSRAWYNNQAPPFAFWVCGNDALVDGTKLLRRFDRGREPHVKVVHKKVIEEYEHLDVIWAMDAVDQVFKEIREVLWKTCNARDMCRVPEGCEDVAAWDPDGNEDTRKKAGNGDDEMESDSSSSSDDEDESS